MSERAAFLGFRFADIVTLCVLAGGFLFGYGQDRASRASDRSELNAVKQVSADTATAVTNLKPTMEYHERRLANLEQQAAATYPKLERMDERLSWMAELMKTRDREGEVSGKGK